MVLSLAWRLPWANLSLRVFGVWRTRRRMLRGSETPRAGGPCSTAELAHAQRYAELAALVAGRAVGPASCLRQALVVEQHLRRRGLPAQLRIGVADAGADAFHAHAWVELDGVALAQPELRHAPISGAADRLL